MQWTALAAAHGKAVLCEKPLGLTPALVAELTALDAAHRCIWESFVFPFHPQTAVLQQLLDEGEIGPWREIHSEFHFPLTNPDNIRLSAERGGGVLLDVGCYPVRLARLLFGSEPIRALAAAGHGEPAGPADVETSGLLDFPDRQRLLFSASFGREPSTFTRILGETGELRLTNPFHPRADDSIELRRGGRSVQHWQPAEGSAFEHCIRHIHAVLAGQAEPRHTIATDAVAQAKALEMIQDAAQVTARKDTP